MVGFKKGVNMDKKRLNKIIAREGLIIIAIIILSVFISIIPSTITVKNIKRELKPNEELYKVTTEWKYNIKKIYELVITKDSRNKEEEWVDVYPKQIPQVDVIPKQIPQSDIIKEQISFQKYKDALILFIILSYPIYLLIRFIIWFIIWAIRTLKEK